MGHADVAPGFVRDANRQLRRLRGRPITLHRPASLSALTFAAAIAALTERVHLSIAALWSAAGGTEPSVPLTVPSPPRDVPRPGGSRAWMRRCGQGSQISDSAAGLNDVDCHKPENRRLPYAGRSLAPTLQRHPPGLPTSGQAGFLLPASQTCNH